jgi:hypothetical protein
VLLDNNTIHVHIYIIVTLFFPVATHVHLAIYIYTRTCVQYGMEMRRNLFVDLLAHEINGYRRFLPANIKHYLSRITERSIQ